MASRLNVLIDLLHTQTDLALATHSTSVPGFPFATEVFFVPDERHCPMLFLSRMAEHTYNLMADSRACLSIAKVKGKGEIARISMIGRILEFEPSPLLMARFRRFRPEADRFMQFGDFRFQRIEPQRIRVVGGFAQAGWVEGRQLLDVPQISLADEARLIEEIQPALPAGVELLGLDAYGVDYRRNDERQRVTFKSGPLRAEAVPATLKRALGKTPA
jgi:heme iron utilization protein